MSFLNVLMFLNAQGLSIHIGWVFIILPLTFFLIKYFLCKNFFKNHEIIEAEISLGNIGKVTIKSNHVVSQIAHEVWVELKTRKAALPFDEEHDLIVEVYDSWYQLFKEIRQLLRKLPAEKVKHNQDAKKLVDILTRSLNEGLRPHLTKYQAKFRKWYKEKSDCDDLGIAPQEIQRQYKDYKELICDIKITNEQLVTYANFIRELAYGK